jgi:hypothetical protein
LPLRPVGTCPKCGSTLYAMSENANIEFCLKCDYERYRVYCPEYEKEIWAPDECKSCPHYWEWPDKHAWGCSYTEVDG